MLSSFFAYGCSIHDDDEDEDDDDDDDDDDDAAFSFFIVNEFSNMHQRDKMTK